MADVSAREQTAAWLSRLPISVRNAAYQLRVIHLDGACAESMENAVLALLAEVEQLREERDKARFDAENTIALGSIGRIAHRYGWLSKPEADELRAEVEQLRERNKAMEECDCMPVAFSSRACPKCGRRGVAYESWLESYQAAEAVVEQQTAALREATDALRYVAGYDVAGYEPHLRAVDVAERAIAALASSSAPTTTETEAT